MVSQSEVTSTPNGRRNVVADDIVLTPGGFRARSLVHQVRPGHGLRAAGGRMQMVNLATDAIVDIPEPTVRPSSIPALGSGWIADAYWNNDTGTPISAFRTTWRVQYPDAKPEGVGRRQGLRRTPDHHPQTRLDHAGGGFVSCRAA